MSEAVYGRTREPASIRYLRSISTLSARAGEGQAGVEGRGVGHERKGELRPQQDLRAANLDRAARAHIHGSEGIFEPNLGTAGDARGQLSLDAEERAVTKAGARAAAGVVLRNEDCAKARADESSNVWRDGTVYFPFSIKLVVDSSSVGPSLKPREACRIVPSSATFGDSRPSMPKSTRTPDLRSGSRRESRCSLPFPADPRRQ